MRLRFSDMVKAGVMYAMPGEQGGGGGSDPEAEAAAAAAAAEAESAAAAANQDAAALLAASQAENASLKASLEEARRAAQPAAPADASAQAALDPLDQAAGELEAAGIPPYADIYNDRLTRRAMAIQAERTKAEVLAIVGQTVIPMQNDRVVNQIAGTDALKREYIAQNIGMFNPNDPKQVAIMELAAAGYAAQKAPPQNAVTPERPNTPAPTLTSDIKAEAASFAMGNQAWQLTDAEIAAALAEAQ